MSIEHVPEPWRSDNYGSFIFDADGNVIVQIRGWGHLQYKGEPEAIKAQEEIQRRIVACVNACRGPSTQAIEEGPTYQEMWDEIQAIRRCTGDDGTHGGPSVLVEYLANDKAESLRERDEARSMVAELAVFMRERVRHRLDCDCHLDDDCDCGLDDLLARAEAIRA